MIDLIMNLLGFGAAKGLNKIIEPPDPSKLTIEYDDAESVLNAASILDQHGEWDRAIELYKYAIRTWPDEHGKYAENCMTEIHDKMSLK